MWVRESCDDSEVTRRLLVACEGGDSRAVAQLLERHQGRVQSLAAALFDRRLQARADAADLAQETQSQVLVQLPDYLARRPLSFRTWVAKTLFDRLGKFKRAHIVAQRRSILQEAPQGIDGGSDATCCAAAEETPYCRLARQEAAGKIQSVLERLSPADKELLRMRYERGMSNSEIGQLWGMDPKTVSKRHGRALLRLRAAAEAEGCGQSDL